MSTELRTILLTTDGSADAAVASRIAAGISEKTHAALHVVHVCTDLAPESILPGIPPGCSTITPIRSRRRPEIY